MRERPWARVRAAKAREKGVDDAKPDPEWMRLGLIGRMRHLNRKDRLRHATLQEVKEK